MKLLSDVKLIVVHCSDTPPTMDVTIDLLRQWHVTENGWSDIGYHWFVKRDGSLHECRSEKYQGAHCKRVNDISLGVCLEGGRNGVDDFTPEQKETLRALIDNKRIMKPLIAVGGHNNYQDKLCPGFDVVHWYYNEKVIM